MLFRIAINYVIFLLSLTKVSCYYTPSVLLKLFHLTYYYVEFLESNNVISIGQKSILYVIDYLPNGGALRGLEVPGSHHNL